MLEVATLQGVQRSTCLMAPAWLAQTTFMCNICTAHLCDVVIYTAPSSSVLSFTVNFINFYGVPIRSGPPNHFIYCNLL